jgi:hypothetical protein
MGAYSSVHYKSYSIFCKSNHIPIYNSGDLTNIKDGKEVFAT